MNRLLLVLLLATLFSVSLNAQEKKKPVVKLSGSIGVFYDIYSFSEENFATFRPRYPDNVLRLQANANLQIGQYFNIPIGINITNQQTLYNLPSVPEESLGDYVQNPANNIHLYPKYKWAQLFLGTQTPLYSQLSTGDIPIFGVGLELNPGKFIFSANYGVSQREIEPDVTFNVQGAYKQDIISARIGIGKIEGSKVTLNIVKIEDDTLSVATRPIGIDPISGVSISPLIQTKIFKKLFLETETAGSIYTSNTVSSQTIDDDVVESVSEYIPINATSRADFAHTTSLDWKAEKFSVGGEVKYIGPGFIPVGYRFVERDIIDYKIRTKLKLLKGKVNFNGSFGIRKNNLQETKAEQTTRVISNFNVFATITEKLSVNASFSNFGFNNDMSTGLNRVELVNNSFSLSPTYMFDTESLKHQITLNTSFNAFDQYDVTAMDFVETRSQTYAGNYNVFFKTMPLTLGVRTIYLNNDLPFSAFKLFTYGVQAGYKLFDKKVIPSLAIDFATINKTGFTTDKRVTARFKVRYKITKKLNFKFNYRFTKFDYGSSQPDALVNQTRMQFSIQQRF